MYYSQLDSSKFLLDHVHVAVLHFFMVKLQDFFPLLFYQKFFH